jgi:hypothetical protein
MYVSALRELAESLFFEARAIRDFKYLGELFFLNWAKCEQL